MKCWSRSTLGIIAGILSIVCYIIASIYFITEFYNGSILLMIVLAVMVLLVIISGLFIIGIVKRNYKLMLPWLFISGIGFISHVTIFLAFSVRVLSEEFINFLALLFLGTFAIGLQALIWWAIYTLYRDVRMNSECGCGCACVIREPEICHSQHTMPYSSQPNSYKLLENRNDHHKYSQCRLP